ncbi:PAS domain S-box protein [Geomonas sp. RF6]|uniref:PAS domain S-box protein n=1 Tax=Geomonas sp. RF6 TaxID=2897342 RepID=UPI001E64159F|nr:PAS domain S-box protein [Geomonas sp. RF6]UFS71729.1 PAS domain S-box protein [Geomonas sp. RF6]
MKVSTRFLYLEVILVAVALATATLCFLFQVKESAQQWALREQAQHLQSFRKLIEEKGSGFRIVNDKLLIGEYVLNGRNELPDAISEVFGGTATIFLGDRRIATNVVNTDGTRAIETVLQGPARTALFSQGRGYRGEALVLGVPSLTAYDPIKTADGETIGALYVGTPKSVYFNMYDRFRKEVVLLAVLLTILFSSVILLLMRLRSKREAELAADELKFRQLFDLQSDAILITDSESGAIVEANTAACRLYGFNRGELVGRPAAELSADGEASLTPGDEGAVCRQRTRSGEVFPAEIRTSSFEWQGRGVTISAIRDVARRERAKDELRESKERLELAVDHARLAQWEYDLATGMFHFNDRFYEVYGTTVGREGSYIVSLDHYLRRFIPAEDAQHVVDQLEAAFSSRDPRHTGQMEHMVVRPNGERRYVVVRYRMGCDPDGRVVKLLGTNQDVTEFRRAEVASRESHHLFRAAFDVIPEYISISTFEDGIFVDVNPGFSRISGYTKAEVIGRSSLEIGLWPVPEIRRQLLQALDEKGFVNGMEGVLRHKDGHLLSVLISAGKVQLQGRSFLFGFVKDITERKRAEDAMSRLNRTLRTLTKCNEALVRAENESQLLHDVCTIVVEEGGHRCAWVAYAESDEKQSVHLAAEAGGSPEYLESLDIVWADTVQGRGPVGTAIRNGKPTYIKDVRTVDSSFAPWRERAEAQGYRSILAVPLFSPVQRGSLNIYSSEADAFDEEEVDLMVQLATDLAYGISALRTRISHQQASQALQITAEEYRSLAATRDQERTLLRGLLDSIPDLIFFKDHSSTYLGCNKAFEYFAGRRERELTGLTDFDLFPEEMARLFREMDRNMMAQRQSRLNEEWVDYPDGRHVLLETLKTPFYDEAGNVRGLIGISRDISERHQAEEERVNLETQLHQAQKMEAVGQLAGGIAHDFNNILTAIMGYSDILANRLEKGSTLAGYAEQVQLATARAAELTSRLLAFSRKQVLRTKPLDVGQVVHDFEKMLARIIPEDIEFTVRLSRPDLVVMADRGQLEQVLMNLVTNARDAMPQGGRLLIEGFRTSMDQRFIHEHGFGREGSYACLSVVDTGLGMDEETRNRIFEPFFTTKELGKGTGLGMAISYGIVKQHNGFIEVNSQRGVGTTFLVYLPLIEEMQKEDEGEAQRHAPAGGREGILLAEDDAAVRQLHKMILEQAGYRVVEALDGQDALEKFVERQDEIELLATDVVMPKLDGKALYEEIRKVRPRIGVLFMSGYTNDIMFQRGLVEGDFILLNKPFTPGELLTKVRGILDGSTE